MVRTVFIICLLISSFLVHGNELIHVKKITYQQGLSENTVIDIAQDSSGYIWIATREGLNRYNGYSCKNYFASEDKQKSLSSSNIQNIFIDSQSKMWVQNAQGIDVYQPEKDSFGKLEIKLPDSYVQRINSVCEQSGIKWLATANQGLAGVDPVTDELLYHSTEMERLTSIEVKTDSTVWIAGNNSIGIFNTRSKSLVYTKKLFHNSSIYRMKQYGGWLWLNTFDGLWLYNENELLTLEEFCESKACNNPVLLKKLTEFFVTDITTHDEKMWLSTDGNGIFSIDMVNNINIENITMAISENSISTDAIRCLFWDRDKNMWIGTVHNGVNLIASQQKKFYNLRHKFDNPDSPNGNFSNFTEDNKNRLWAATFDGLCQIDQQTMNVKKFVGKGKVINTITIDWEGNIFMGTYQQGLYKYSPDNNELRKLNFAKTDFDSNSINALLTDHYGNIWIGTSSALFILFKDGELVQFGEETPLRGITCLLEDENQNIWIGSVNGVFMIFPVRNMKDQGWKNSLVKIAGNYANCLFEDHEGNIWLGTNSNGLYRISKGNHEIIHYKKKDQVLSNVVYGIAEDNSYNLWFTTNSGLVSYNPGSWEMHVYNFTDGLINNQYIRESIYHTQQGKMLCGGENGIDYFSPPSITNNTTPPELIIDGFFVDGNPVVSGNEEGIYQRRLEEENKLIFRYNQSSFGFRFTGIDYANPHKIQYAYKLEGLSNNWIYVKNDRTVNYGHVPPGKYTFKVKAANGDGFWTREPEVVQIEVKPPFVQTPLAYLLYAIVIGGILYVTYRYLLERKLMQNKLQHESAERKRVEELNQFKLRLFTHISHEFRTPLSLIIAPVQELLKRFKPEDVIYHDLTTVNNNARKLQVLVNQVLEVRKIESGAVQLNKSNIDIVPFLKSSCESFRHWANQKNIRLSFSSEMKELVLSIDQSLMEKIVYNLLSNAIKYTEKGFVELSLKTEGENCCVEIRDSGVGIPELHRKRLFEMFYRVDEHSINREGSGVGLALCKELVELHNGQITVESEPGSGSIFTVKLPLPKNELELIKATADYTMEEDNSKGKIGKKPVVLLVDDNEELRTFLAQKLLNYFEILEAENGAVALKVAQEKQPTLIISDVMMPEMDGWELCKRIKTDVETSHIPLILLTALSETEQTIKGLNLGANAYLAKPFNIDHIVSLVQNILDRREKLKARYKKGETETVDADQLSELDKKLLDNARSKTMENMSQPDFSVQTLSNLLGMSRVNLHLKLKALCDLTPSEFIMQLRLKEAVRLLKEKKYQISEISDLTGFSTASHFSRNFKKQFGGSPSDFIKGKIKITTNN